MKFDKMTRSGLAVLAVSLLVVSSYGQTISEVKEPGLKTRIERKLVEWHSNANFPGATVGVCVDEAPCIGQSVGYADRKTQQVLSPKDLMFAGSVGKTFAAAVALQLVAEGKIDLDKRIYEYLGDRPWFPRLPNAKDITVRQLMNHTSGLVRYEFNQQFIKDMLTDPEREWMPEEQVAYLLDSKAAFEAGKGWDYSDTNYIVLGMIIEKVTGKKYYDLAMERVISPLDLEHTKPQRGSRIEGLVQGYAGAGNPFGGKDEVLKNGNYYFNPSFEWTGGGFVTNPLDLARWAKMLYEGKVFPKDALNEMLEGVDSPMLGREAKYGLGVIIRQTPHGVSYGHSGFFPGYLTDVMYFPEHRISVAVQVNTSVPADLGRPLSRVLVEIAGEALTSGGMSSGHQYDRKSRWATATGLRP